MLAEAPAVAQHRRIRRKLRAVVIELVPEEWLGASFIRSTLFRLIDNAPPKAIDVMLSRIRELVDESEAPA